MSAKSTRQSWLSGELHDRIIVATARLLGVKIITKDEDIKDSGIVEVVW